MIEYSNNNLSYYTLQDIYRRVPNETYQTRNERIVNEYIRYKDRLNQSVVP